MINPIAYAETLSLYLWSVRSIAQGEVWRPLKGAVSAQKALQGSETKTRELLEETEEKKVSLHKGVINIPLQANQWFVFNLLGPSPTICLLAPSLREVDTI